MVDLWSADALKKEIDEAEGWAHISLEGVTVYEVFGVSQIYPY